MANKKQEDFIYRDFIGAPISQDEFEEVMLEVLEEEEKYSLKDYLDMLQMSSDDLKQHIQNIKSQYPELFRYGKERIYLCRELEKAKRDSDLHLICLLLCDDGILTETSNTGGKRKVYQDHFKMDVGLSVRDWRSTCRIANISVADLSGDGAADLEELLNKAYYKIRRFAKTGKTAIYCNSTVLMYFEAQLKAKTNVNYTIKEYLNENVLHYKNIPIRECDQITCVEDLVS